MKVRDRFLRLCLKSLEDRGLSNDQRYRVRLKKEIKEIDAQGEHDYLVTLHDKFKANNLKFPINQYNNLVDWLLGLTDEFDIEKTSTYVQGESPDIDIDYLKDVRDYIKRVWAPNHFGQERVCEIGTYGTSGIKSAILDMARLYGLPRDEIQSITSKMADKDDEGHELEWDKALELYPQFKEYCETNLQVAEAAKLLLDRNRSGGVHAGGLIIADRRLDGFVPLEVRMVNKENPNGVICSAWTEGLNRQDLQPVGLVKFDLLVISNLMQIALASKLVKEHHGIDKINALPGQWDWSDISYLNDPKALEMANRGDLKCIFQFDSEGIRKLVKRGGVSSFDDLAAYSAIYRPGPLNVGMDVSYCRRKKGEEPYNIHPLMQPALGKTYGIMIYQEQVMEILRVVGEVPDALTEKVRKAISKKKVKEFMKYKEMFIENGQKNLGVNPEYIENLWGNIESFAEYGFNQSIKEDTKIHSTKGFKQIKDFRKGDVVYCLDTSGEVCKTEVVALHDHGMIEGFEVTFDDGYKIVCSANHKFLTEKGQVPLKEIYKSDSAILSANQGEFHAEEERGWMEDDLRRSTFESSGEDNSLCKLQQMQGIERRCEAAKNEAYCSLWRGISDLDAGHAPISNTGGLVRRMIVRIRPVGRCHMFDLEVANPTHNFILPNGIVTSNSHAYAYSYISARLLWLKAHYPLEFYTAILMCENDSAKLKDYKLDAEKHGIEVCPVHINKSKKNFSINDGKIYFGFSNIKKIGEDVADRVVDGQEYQNFPDFLEKFGTDANVIKALVALGVFDEDYDRITLRKFSEWYKKNMSSRKDRKKRFEQSIDKRYEELRQLLLEEVPQDDPEFESMCDFTPEAEAIWERRFSGIVREIPYKYKGEDRTREVTFLKMVQDIAKKRQNSIENFAQKEKDDAEMSLSMDQFSPNSIKLDPEEEKILSDELVINGKTSYPMAENLYYGFQWTHVLEASMDYTGQTIDKFLDEVDKGLQTGPIEVQIQAVRKRTSKNGNEFYSIDVEDANGKRMSVIFWMDDYTRFKDDLTVGNLVSMRVHPPGAGYNTLSFKSVPRHERRKLPPKEEDERLIVLRPPEKSSPAEVDEEFLENMKFDSNAIEFLN